MDDYAARRLAELKAAAPTKRKKKADPFAKVPLWFAKAAAEATNTKRALVWVAMIYAAFDAKGLTFSFGNVRLKQLGVHRSTKDRALHQLEEAGLITVERRRGKTPIVTIIVL